MHDKIVHLQTNYQVNPLGIELKDIVFSWKQTQNYEKEKFVVALDESFKDEVFSSEVNMKDAICYSPEFEFQPGTKYFWKVGDSEIASFEGGHPDEKWRGKWIKPCFDAVFSPVFKKTFSCERIPKSARLYICGLGLYEVYINGEKVGDEFLTPYFTDYRYWMQYQTYDVVSYLKKGENTISVILGEGWYKGRLGFADHALHRNHYGTEYKMLCDLYLYDTDVTVFGSDETWSCIKSPVIASNIYDGEIWDGRNHNAFTPQSAGELKSQFAIAPKGELVPMTGARVTRHEVLKPVELITSKIGETIIDFGQEITGWVSFKTKQRRDTKVSVLYSEIMQDGKFYQDNLRTATAQHIVYTDGEETIYRPHFTFYGFRYVKVEGMEVTGENLNDFEAWALYSDLTETGNISTSHEGLNRLIMNTKWSQKDNFLDIPTDCPQRDERLGWTGDAQIFCSAASYHMQTPCFYRKYMKDMLCAQKEHRGAVPYVIPDVLLIEREQNGEPEFDFTNDSWGEAGSSVWGDAATIISWNMYVHYGNKKWLASEYENMTQWVLFIKNMDEMHCGGKRLWNCGFHFGDWLSLDAEEGNLQGGTDKYYISSVYYMYSSLLTAKAAKVLGKEDDFETYSKLSNEVREAIRKEYLQEGGFLSIDTQTAYAVGITFDVFEESEKKKAGEHLVYLLEQNNGKLATGFVGTAFLLEALVQTGHSKQAYDLLLNEEYPGWLYEVNLGATTIWERWNSVLPDGSISDTGMNSLNHYAYGCVVNWIYRWVCGIQFDEENPAGKKMLIHPLFDTSLQHAKGYVDTMVGRYSVSWEKNDTGVTIEIVIPTGGSADYIRGDKCVTLLSGVHVIKENA